ncbi:hypothetical protein BH18VER1_BH18VER1_11020 [soil metagenome]
MNCIRAWVLVLLRRLRRAPLRCGADAETARDFRIAEAFGQPAADLLLARREVRESIRYFFGDPPRKSRRIRDRDRWSDEGRVRCFWREIASGFLSRLHRADLGGSARGAIFLERGGAAIAQPSSGPGLNVPSVSGIRSPVSDCMPDDIIQAVARRSCRRSPFNTLMHGLTTTPQLGRGYM